jgi:hypothetical protein
MLGFVSLAGIEVPPPFENLDLVLNDSIAGTKLHEGDRPVGYWINHDALAQYSKIWRKMTAFAEDSTGKRYVSSYPAAKEKPPRWVVPD